MSSDTQMLRHVLRANAAFSLLSGMGLSIFYTAMADLMAIANDRVLLFIGIALVGFSLTVFWTASKNLMSKKQVKSVIVQDYLWVAASLLVIVFQVGNLNPTGYLIIAAVALIVGSFAFLQAKFLRRLN